MPCAAGSWFPARPAVRVASPAIPYIATNVGQITLYAVRNQDLVAVIELAPDLSSDAVVDELSGDFDVPTTVAPVRLLALRRQLQVRRDG